MYPMAGNIYYADLPYLENVQSGKRPVIVTQNNTGNKHASFVHVIPLTTRVNKARHMPTHIILSPSDSNGLTKESVAIIENMRPVSKDRLGKHVGRLCSEELSRIGDAMRIQFPFM